MSEKVTTLILASTYKAEWGRDTRNNLTSPPGVNVCFINEIVPETIHVEVNVPSQPERCRWFVNQIHTGSY